MLQKLKADASRMEQEIPRDQASIEKLTADLAKQETILESHQEDIKGEVETYHKQMSKVRCTRCLL